MHESLIAFRGEEGVGVDVATRAAFLEICDDDGRNLNSHARKLVIRARQLIEDGNAPDFLVQKIVDAFRKAVAIHSATGNGKEWH